MCNALQLYCPGSKLVVNIFFSPCLVTRTPKAEIASKSDIHTEREKRRYTINLSAVSSMTELRRKMKSALYHNAVAARNTPTTAVILGRCNLAIPSVWFYVSFSIQHAQPADNIDNGSEAPL